MAKKHIIVLGGLPGSGKSTTVGVIAERLGYDTFSTGDFTREMAIERGLTLEAFNEECARSGDIDHTIDAELKKIEGSKDKMVVDSHLAFHFIPSSFKVFLDISLEQSAKRIFNDSTSAIRKRSGDTMETLEEAYERTQKRIENHKERYRRLYGLDPYDASQFDLIVDATRDTPEDIATMVIDAYNAWLNT
jgi:cytidylate kinase